MVPHLPLKLLWNAFYTKTLLFNPFAQSADPSCEAVSVDVACGCGGEGGVRNGGEDGEMCRHSVAPLAWERGSHEIEKLAPRGRKRSLRGVKFRAPGGPKWLSGGLWRRPGASWAAGEAQEGALSGKGSLLFFLKGPKKYFLERPGSILGSSWRLLGRFWILFLGARGGSGRTFLEVL